MTEYIKDLAPSLSAEEELTPRQIVTKLDEHIIGQKNDEKGGSNRS